MKTLLSLLIVLSSVVQAATIYTPPKDWYGQSWHGTYTNPSSSWAIRNQIKDAAYTDSYTIGSYIPYGTNYYFAGYGLGDAAIIHSDAAGVVSFLTWPSGADPGPYGVLEFTAPTAGLATISGTVTTPGLVWSYIDVYKLNAAGTAAVELGTYSITAYDNYRPSATFNLANVSVASGDRIMLRWCNGDANYQIGTLTNYQIEMVPEPAGLFMLCAGGLLLTRRLRRK